MNCFKPKSRSRISVFIFVLNFWIFAIFGSDGQNLWEQLGDLGGDYDLSTLHLNSFMNEVSSESNPETPDVPKIDDARVQNQGTRASSRISKRLLQNFESEEEVYIDVFSTDSFDHNDRTDLSKKRKQPSQAFHPNIEHKLQKRPKSNTGEKKTIPQNTNSSQSMIKNEENQQRILLMQMEIKNLKQQIDHLTMKEHQLEEKLRQSKTREDAYNQKNNRLTGQLYQLLLDYQGFQNIFHDIIISKKNNQENLKLL